MSVVRKFSLIYIWHLLFIHAVNSMSMSRGYYIFGQSKQISKTKYSRCFFCFVAILFLCLTTTLCVFVRCKINSNMFALAVQEALACPIQGPSPNCYLNGRKPNWWYQRHTHHGLASWIIQWTVPEWIRRRRRRRLIFVISFTWTVIMWLL